MPISLSGSLIITGSLTTTGEIIMSGSIASASYATNAANSTLFNNTASSVFATTGSNTFTGTQYISNTNNATGFSSTTSSIYTDGGLQVTKDAYYSSSLFIKGNLTVFGTQSVSFITSSQLNISTNLITVNTDTPSIRFGGLAVYDSGSTGLTGSILWDSQNNHWIYTNPSGSSYSGGMLISGPRNTGSMGDEQGTTSNAIMKGMGGDHITSSAIFENGASASFYTNALIVSSSGDTRFGSITGNTHQFTGSMSVSGSGTFVGNIIAGDVIRVSGSGAYLSIYDTQASSKNWAIRAGHDAVGDLAIRQSNSTGGDPVSAGTTRLYINASGNVGIGTTSPTAKLEIFDNTNSGILRLSRDIGNARGQVQFGRNNGGSFQECGTIIVDSDTASVNNGVMYFYTSNSSGTNTERMRITSGGNVLIGTTTAPTAIAVNDLLVIGKSGSASNAINFSNGSTTNWGYLLAESGKMVLGSGTSSNITFETNAGTERMRITSAGNIGIGISTPAGAHMLQINNPTQNYVRMNMTNTSTGTSNSDGLIFQQEIGNSIIKNQENGYFAFGVNGAEDNIVIAQGGNVLIGSTSNPGQKLYVAGDIRCVRLFPNSGGNATDPIIAPSDDTNNGIFFPQADTFAITTGGTERMRVNSNGRIGIAETNSSIDAKLLVRTDGDAYNIYCDAHAVYASNYRFMRFRVTSNRTTIGAIESSDGVNTVYSTTSDYRLKEDLKDFNGLEKLSDIKVYDFKWKDIEHRTYGVLAHELQEIIPYAVTGQKDAIDEDGTFRTQGVDYSKIVPVLVKAIQELTTRVQELENK